MPNPVKAIRVNFLNIFHTLFTHYFLISTPQIPQMFFDRSTNDQCRKGNLTLSWRNRCHICESCVFMLLILKTVPLKSPSELGMCVHLSCHKRHTLPHIPMRNEESQKSLKLWLHVAASCVMNWNEHGASESARDTDFCWAYTERC